MPKLYFENAEMGTRFDVVEFNSADGTVTLLGRANVPFVQEFDKDKFIEWGYTLKQEADAPPPPAAAAPAPPPPPPVPQPSAA